MKQDNPTSEVIRIERLLKATRTKIARLREYEQRYERAIAALRGEVSSPPAATPRTVPNGATPRMEEREHRGWTFHFPSTPSPRYRDGESMIGYAERVLRASDAPLPILALVARMIEGGYPQPDKRKVRDSLQRTIDRQIERNSGQFRKAPGKSTYTLKPTVFQVPLISEEAG